MMIGLRNVSQLKSALCGTIALPLIAISGSTFAQEPNGTTAREVVQPLPSKEVTRLNQALMALAQRPQSISALVEAGNAALQLDDLDAAMGFFGRASEIEPGNARAKMGIAAVYIRSGRPIDALRLFREAESAGASASEVLLDRGLAFDLIGNSSQAQETYRAAIGAKPSQEGTRRLALSYAISGDSEAFEQTLRPLLEQRDLAAYRARAFGLAILGNTSGAAAIADAVMPRDLAARMIPYLEFMPRLTKAQQAAAANLGIFPRAAEIGRDDPRIAEFARIGSDITAAAESRLAPSGVPLGESASLEDTSQANASDGGGQAEIAGQLTDPENVPAPSLDLERFSFAGGDRSEADTLEAEASLHETKQEAGPANDQVRVTRGEDEASSPTQVPPVEAQEQGELASVETAFANFNLEANDANEKQGGAVDISTIEIPREVAPKPDPSPPAHPSRVWVQVAIGRDRAALRFDWRRFQRQAPELLADFDPHVTRWGRTNRLLAGPLGSRREARDLVNGLKNQGIDTFTFLSAEGQEIQRLGR